MYAGIQVNLTGKAVPAPEAMAPSEQENFVRWLLLNVGVDLDEAQRALNEIREARREALEAEIAAVDQETVALAERRQALVQALWNNSKR